MGIIWSYKAYERVPWLFRLATSKSSTHFTIHLHERMSVITTQVVKHNGDVVWYPIFQFAIIVGCSSIWADVVAVISYLSIFRVIKLFEADVTLLCCHVFCLQHSSKFFIQPLYLFFYVFYELFHTVFTLHFHRQRYCVHSILTVHLFSSFPCMVPCLVSQSSLYSTYPCTAHQLVLKYSQSLHTV